MPDQPMHGNLKWRGFRTNDPRHLRSLRINRGAGPPPRIRPVANLVAAVHDFVLMAARPQPAYPPPQDAALAIIIIWR
jgi:hypothetical protein